MDLPRRQRHRPGIAVRLLAAFGAVILSFAGAIALSAWAQRQALLDLDEVLRLEDAARSGLRLASLVREQYIHQAHVIVRGESSHVGRSRAASEAVQQELVALRARRLGEEVGGELEQIHEAAGALDRVFLNQILPSVEAEDWPKVRSEHERAQALVEEITASAAALERTLTGRAATARELAQARSRRAFALTVGLLGFAIAVGAGMSLYAFRSIVQPLRSLEEGATRIGAGDLSARIRVSSSDEIGHLAERFNQMTQELAAHQERLVAAERLAGLGRLAAGVAHELNNPLGVALGYTRLLAKSAPAELRGDLKVIDEEVVRAHQIVQDLLGLARENNPARAEALDLAGLAAEVVERQRAASDGAAARLELGALPPLRAVGDPDRLRQVLANLVRNAAQAAGKDGTVWVSGASTPEHAEVRVEDTGPGLSPEARARLFEPFFTTRAQGTGLGLAVSLAIAQAHRGTIVAENRPEGGARFTLRLPRASAEVPA